MITVGSNDGNLDGDEDGGVEGFIVGKNDGALVGDEDGDVEGAFSKNNKAAFISYFQSVPFMKYDWRAV